MYFVKPISMAALGLLLASCSSAAPKAQYSHVEYGSIGSDHPQLVAAREECGKVAYAQGIEINGQRVTDRAVAIKAWAQFMVDQVMKPGAGAIAGTQGALAVSTGNPNLATQPGSVHASSANTSLKKPPYAARMDELEQQVWDCVTEKGFIKMS